MAHPYKQHRESERKAGRARYKASGGRIAAAGAADDANFLGKVLASQGDMSRQGGEKQLKMFMRGQTRSGEEDPFIKSDMGKAQEISDTVPRRED